MSKSTYKTTAAFPPDYEAVDLTCEEQREVVGQAKRTTVRRPFWGKHPPVVGAWLVPSEFGRRKVIDDGGHGAVQLDNGALLDLRTGEIAKSKSVCRDASGRVRLRNGAPV